MKYLRKKGIVTILVISLILVVLGKSFIVYADEKSSSDLIKERQANQSEINETQNEKKEVQAQMTAVQKEVEELNAKIASYENEIDDLTSEIDDTTAKIDTMTQELAQKQKELEEKEELLKKRLIASYKAGSTSYLDVLLSSGSLTNFLSNYYLIEQLADSDQKLITTISDTKNQIEESKNALEESKKTLESDRELQQNKKSALDVTKNEKSQKVAQLSAEDQDLQKQIEEMQAQDTAIRDAIKKAQADEKRRADEIAKNNSKNNNSNSGNTGNTGNTGNSNNGGSSSPSSNPGGFIYPVPSAYAKITTGLYYSNGSYHGGVDFGSGGIAGQPVYAVKSGTVILALALNYSYGNYILIDHHDGTYTLYAHGQAGSICVSPGQKVSQGQQIMRVGSTGNSTGAHLHFEVRTSPGGFNNRVNPRNYLP